MPGFGRIKEIDTANCIIFPYAEWKLWIVCYRIISVSIDTAIRNYFISVRARYLDGTVRTLNCAKFDLAPDFKPGSKGSQMYSPEIFGRLTMALDSFWMFMAGAHLIVVERPPVDNVKNTAIFRHTNAYFMSKFRRSNCPPILSDVHSKMKGKVFGVPKGVTGKALKDWSVEKGRQLLKKQKDKFGLELSESIRKHRGRWSPDDFTDCILQEEAWFLIMGICTSLPERWYDKLGVNAKLIPVWPNEMDRFVDDYNKLGKVAPGRTVKRVTKKGKVRSGEW